MAKWIDPIKVLWRSPTLIINKKSWVVLSDNKHINFNWNNSTYLIQDGKVDRSDTSFADFTNFDYLQPAGVPTEDETHSGADVGIYALGKFHIPNDLIQRSLTDETWINSLKKFQ